MYTVAIGEARIRGVRVAGGVCRRPRRRPTSWPGSRKQTGAKALHDAARPDQLTQVYNTLGSRLSTELAIDESAGPYVIAAIVMTLIAATVLLVGTRDPYA